MSNITRTNRGFAELHMADGNGVAYSLQVSSAARDDGPMLWLGCESLNPRCWVMSEQGWGEWKPVDLPPRTITNARLHMGQAEVRNLAEALNYWLENGQLPGEDEPTTGATETGK